jgi:hypothetical protein
VRMGVNPSTRARWERGERTPEGRFLAKVSEMLSSETGTRRGSPWRMVEASPEPLRVCPSCQPPRLEKGQPNGKT